jgi:cellulose synthase/poly-beta-1,6-N-acetylglucosamine synthase-like glycosyltransferase
VYVLSLYFAVFWFLVLIEKGVERENKKLRGFPHVTIVIPAHNEERVIESTIKSALSLNYPKDKTEIIAVNHGSTDKTLSIMNKYRDKIKIISIDRNPDERKGAPMNAALKVAKGEFFVCLDADSIPEKDALLKILPHFSDRDVACVLPSMKVDNPKSFWQKAQWTEYLVNMFYKKLMGNLNCIHVAPGPFSVYRTDVLRKVGGYDEKNLTEDLEITYKLQKNQYRIIQLLDTQVHTKSPQTFRQLYSQRNRWFKGAFLTTIQYRKMMFNRKYGDFAIIQLPVVIISGILAMTLLLTSLYYAIQPRLNFLANMSTINFDFWTLLKNFSFNFNLFDLNYALIMSSIFMLLFSVIIVYKSHKHSNEKLLRNGILPFLFFFIYYYLIMGIAWVGVTIDLLMKKVQRW